MAKELIKQIEEYVDLYRDTQTSIAWVENGKTGTGHSAHPSIDTLSRPERQTVLNLNVGMVFFISKMGTEWG